MSETGMQETEAKFYVLDLKRVEVRLQEIGAVLLHPRVLETNIRFDLPDGRLLLEGRVLRLRRDTEARLTYKGASTNDQGVLSRSEIEFTVEDFEKAKAFLEALGYRPIFVYEKYRTTYTLESESLLASSPPQVSASDHGDTVDVQTCHIMLDELPYGSFIEIEGESIESIQKAANQLNLNWNTAIGTSYHALFNALSAKRSDLDPTQLTFAAMDGMKITGEELSVQAADAY